MSVLILWLGICVLGGRRPRPHARGCSSMSSRNQIRIQSQRARTTLRAIRFPQRDHCRSNPVHQGHYTLLHQSYDLPVEELLNFSPARGSVLQYPTGLINKSLPPRPRDTFTLSFPLQKGLSCVVLFCVVETHSQRASERGYFILSCLVLGAKLHRSLVKRE